MQTLTRHESTSVSPYEPTTLAEALGLAERLSKSGLVPDALKNKPQDVLVIVMTGHELGLGTMQSLRSISVVNGKAIISADLAVSLAKKHPECLYFRLVESTSERATYETERKGEGKTRMDWTMKQAAEAGLVGRGPWKTYPAAMLRARCGMALARAVFPDALLGVYDPDEAQDMKGGRPAAVAVEINALPATATQTPAPQPEDAALVDATPAPAPQASPEDALVAELVAAVHSANTLRDLRATGAKIAASKLGNRPGLRDAYASRQRDLHQKRG